MNYKITKIEESEVSPNYMAVEVSYLEKGVLTFMISKSEIELSDLKVGSIIQMQ